MAVVLPTNEVVCGDCLEVMRGLPDNCVDITLTSPPFNVGIKYDIYDDNRDDYYAWLTDVCGEIERITKGVCYIFMAQKHMCELKTMLRGFHQWLFWHRPNIPGSSINFAWSPTVTPIAMSFPNKRSKMLNAAKYNVDRFDLITACSPQTNFKGELKRYHVVQDPIMAYKPLIARTPGDIVWDPFMGVGTTAIAALQLDRKFAGCEISPDYITIANNRLAPVRE